MSRTKNKRRLSKREYLLSSKKCFLIEDKLLPLYSHLVESYSDQLKDTWAVKVEESQFGSVQIKEEPADEINYDASLILPMNEDVSASSPQEFDNFNPSEDSYSHCSESNQQKSLTGPKKNEDTPNNRTCTVCSKVFSRLSHLTAHMIIHSGEKPYGCSECDKRFCTKGHLNQHLFTHTGEKPYSCEQCDFTCSQKSQLTRHLRTHTGHKPYMCDVCGASFAHSSNCKRHKLTHTGDKKYKCEQCGKMFAEKHHLTRHIRTHSGEKPYGCDVCGRMFAQSSTRNRHSSRCSSTVTYGQNKEYKYVPVAFK